MSKRPPQHMPTKHTNIDGVFLNDTYRTVRGEIAVWTGVLTQALMDASSKSKHPDMRKAKREAIAWIREAGADFITVCDLAQMDPKITHQKMMRALDNDCVWHLPNDQDWRSKLRQQYSQVLATGPNDETPERQS